MMTPEYLRERLDYDPATGKMVWRHWARSRSKNWNTLHAGREIRTTSTQGYYRFKLDGRQVLMHRAAWCIVHGSWPSRELDHINGIPLDNRIANLRLATRAENNQNMVRPRRNTSGYTGIVYMPKTGKWAARIQTKGARKFLGYFDTKEIAAASYTAAKAKLHTFNPVERLPCPGLAATV